MHIIYCFYIYLHTSKTFQEAELTTVQCELKPSKFFLVDFNS